MIRIGFSKDIHRIIKGRKLVLGGVTINFNDYGLLGHSDADVVLHAVAESILGALSLNDLGYYFPDSDDKYKNIDSSKILCEVINMMSDMKYRISNIDILIELELFKLKPYINDIKESLSKLLGINLNQISVKAATNEGLDSVGRKEACIAYSNVLLESYE